MITRSRSSRALSRLLTAALSLIVMMGLLQAPPTAASATATSASATVLTPPLDLAEMWGRYGNAGGHWTGGDATVSIPLPDGRIAWIFSDSFLGAVNPDYSRPQDAPFLRNSMVIQNGSNLGPTLHGGTAAAPTSLIDTDLSSDDFYWVGDGTVEGNTLKVIYGRYLSTNDGTPLGFKRQGTALATFSLPDLRVISVRQMPVSDSMTWGSALMEDGGYSYIYGSEYADGAKFVHLARAKAGDLGGPWEFWTGSGWSDKESDSARLISGVGEGMSVSKVGNQYAMITQENNDLFSGWIVAYVSNAPTGPFSGPTYLYEAPEPEISNRRQFVYVGRHHPELSDPGKLLLTYDVNAWDPEDLYRDVRIYRPRFVEVQWPPAVPDPSKLPGAPTNLSVRMAGDGTAHLTWTAPPGSGLNYWVYKKDLTAGQTHFTRTGNPVTETRYGDPFLKEGHTYAFHVRAITTAGHEGPPSNTVNTESRKTAPPAPSGLVATAGVAGDVKLTWNASDPGVTYRVYQRDVTVGETVFTESATEDPLLESATLRDLIATHVYEFKVTAVNDIGESPPSNLARATAVFTPPGAPGNLAATAQSDGSIKLTWTAVAGADRYWVRLRDVTSGATDFTKIELPVHGTTTTLTHLLSGNAYEFKVTAGNDGGEGPASNVASATAKVALPDAPTGLVATPQADGSVKLTWTAAARAKTYWIYRRDVTFGHTEFSRYHLPASGTSAVIADLFNGNTYEFKVTGVGDGGEGPASAVVSAVSRVTPPQAPTGLRAEPGDGTVRLSWTAPVGASMYWVYQRDVTAGESTFTRLAYPAGQPSADLQGLVNGHTYEYKITGINDAGEGPASGVVSVVPKPPAPPKVTGVSAQPQQDGTVKLTWTPIDGSFYWLSYRDTTAGQTSYTRLEYPATTNSAQIGPFTGGHAYDFLVTATNPGGDGPPSDPVRVTILGSATLGKVSMPKPAAKASVKAAAALPRPPTNLRVTQRTRDFVALEWDASPDHGSVYYWVQFRSVGRSEWYNLTYPTLNVTYHVGKPLWPGFQYEFRVVAENQTGASSPTNTVRSALGGSPPPRPTGLTVGSTANGVDLLWTQTAEEDFYWVEFKPSGTGTWYRLAWPATWHEASIGAPLWRGYSYDFRVIAVNRDGESPPSSSVSAVPDYPKPQPPSALYHTDGPGWSRISWNDSGSDVMYWLYYRPAGGGSWTRARYPLAQSEITLKYLPIGRYDVRVTAVNMRGESAASPTITIRLKPSKAHMLAMLTEISTAGWNRWLGLDGGDAYYIDGYDWDHSTDLCSGSPDRPVLGLAPFERVDWRKQCARHDFGYRNYKAMGAFDYNRKLRIDRMFYRDMLVACDAQIVHHGVKCIGLAHVYYAAVLKLGT
ncbi:phospholipase A2 [Nonomuraea turcica]|uniref:phospholipase A2 n=1 Tax=Nonomuraea sp. G32 TaxID=3067274 RepID=UPI00273CD9C0|nr:phospholipase A2 [Nonomuraea sp. G32]MDP4505024.1 phospholipase A2 [Nonomuraea sp. G32]